MTYLFALVLITWAIGTGGASASTNPSVEGEWLCEVSLGPQGSGYQRGFRLVLHPDGSLLGEGQGASGPYLLQGKWQPRAEGRVFAYGEERQLLEPRLSGRFAYELEVAGAERLLSRDPKGRCRRATKP